jgi:Glycosyltransferase 61
MTNFMPDSELMPPTSPRRYLSSAERVASWSAKSGVNTVYRQIHDVEIAKHQEPKGLEQGVSTWKSLRAVHIPEAYTAVIPDGHVCGDGNHYSVVTTADRKPFCDSSFGERKRDLGTGSEILNLPPATFIPGNVAFLAMRPDWMKPYFHWMIQILPRFHLLRESEIAIDRYVINALTASFQHETLAALGIDEASLIEVDTRFDIHARQVAISSVAPAWSPTWVCEFLRREFLRSEPPPGNDRLYIRRLARPGEPMGRGILNENEVKEVLDSFGFKEFVPEQVTVADQARAFASASFIAGAHGSAFTNLVFCRPGTKVVEFFSPVYVHPVYWMLSGRCHLDYRYLVGRGERSATWDGLPPPGSPGHEWIEIDTDQLVKLLRMAGL